MPNTLNSKINELDQLWNLPALGGTHYNVCQRANCKEPTKIASPFLEDLPIVQNRLDSYVASSIGCDTDDSNGLLSRDPKSENHPRVRSSFRACISIEKPLTYESTSQGNPILLDFRHMQT